MATINKKNKTKFNNNNLFNFIDLCCGIGGFHSAIKKIENINSNLVFSADIDKNCRKTYSLNYGKTPEKDLTCLDLDKLVGDTNINGICAGFPCQPFSYAGKRLGLDDIRGTIIYYILDMISRYKPDLVCLENVKGIKSMINQDKNGVKISIYEFIKQNLDNNGYFVYDRIISPHEINIPQKRERVVFVCVKKSLLPLYTIQDYITNFNQEIQTLISDTRCSNKSLKILEDDNTVEKRFLLKGVKKTSLELWEKFVSLPEWDTITNQELLDIYNNKLNKKSRINFKQYHFFLNFRDFQTSCEIPDSLKHLRTRDISVCFKSACDIWNLLYDNHDGLKQLIDRFLNENQQTIDTLPFLLRYLDYSGGEDYCSTTTLNNKYAQIRQSGLRVRKGGIFPTLVKSGQRPIIVGKMRYLTNIEMLRLQSFPDDFKTINDSTIMKQCGNAVNTEVIRIMIQSGFNLINKK